MNDQNRYEEVPQKENKFLKALKGLGNYFKFVFIDFINSFKYNNMKLAAIIFALPGILLGFFMFAHVPTIRKVTVAYDQVIADSSARINTTLDSETATDSDFLLTIDKYNGYENIAMKLVSYDQLKEEEGFKQDEYPINGYSSDSSATQLPKPIIKSFSDSSSESDSTSDSYSILIEGLTETDLSNASSYALFVFQSVKIGETEVVDPEDSTKTIKEDVYGDYFISNIYRTLDANIESIPLNNFSTLNKNYKYKVAVKAITNKAGYYASDLSDLFDISDIVTKSGSEVSAQDYDEYNTRYVCLAGKYSVYKVNGADPSGDLSNFTVSISANGYITYNFNGKEARAQLSGNVQSGSYIQSTEVKRVHVLPFDFSGMCIFFLTLLGFLNVFLSLELSKKKNLGSVIKAMLTTIAIIAFGALYIYSLVATNSHLGEGKLSILDSKNNVVKSVFDQSCIVSITAVCASAVFSIIGLVLAFINYDRTYEKVDR